MNQHLSEEVEARAALYALGALADDEARAFEEHVAEGCAACSEELRDYETVVGLIGIGAPEASPSGQVRERLLKFLEGDGQDSTTHLPTAGDAQQTLTIRADEGQWQEIQQGIFMKSLFADQTRGTTTVLIRMSPGTYLPRHRHYGAEECLVLEGDVRAGGQMLRAGDYHCAMADSVHDRLSTVNGALLLIVGPPSCEVLEHF
ncbi:MAG TPA: cupin domain-containing protein [Pyrinomonadaceae bacterium]|nr:cupin domain-containing protein [Pyrinomonadaceae bacterium]